MTVPAQRLAFEIPAEDLQVPRARTLVRAHLNRWGCSADSDTGAAALLLLTELTTNAVRHAATSPIAIAITVDGAGLCIAVHDRNPSRPVFTGRAPCTDATSGRGLSIVAAVTEELGGALTMATDRDGGGKTVRVHLPWAAPALCAGVLPSDTSPLGVRQSGSACRAPLRPAPANDTREVEDRV
ncbi:ATP-binding protein [Yinghuangia sp. ASG 101]|uniref:ATP-binding protein n=1 Tax=Yinghuangia sp. ASG 101 TaxID=2896848 RepID=UPI001E59F851|nr:ATP-binding protein [Yinghuangia sp. ASG 101]UGQ10976.1 ATP-binding protein [Yinghuangia sp. ASG 101]